MQKDQSKPRWYSYFEEDNTPTARIMHENEMLSFVITGKYINLLFRESDENDEKHMDAFSKVRFNAQDVQALKAARMLAYKMVKQFDVVLDEIEKETNQSK